MKKILSYLVISLALLTSCEEEIPGDIIENLPLVASYSITHVSERGASDGAITVTVTEGTDPYQFKLNGGVFQSESSFTGLPADTFYVTVMDGVEDIFVINDIIIKEPSLTNMTINTTFTNVSTFNGNDGSVSVDVNGGVPPYLYKLNDGVFIEENIFDGLVSGTHSMTVKDNVDSTKTINFVITQPDYIPMTITVNTTNVSAFGADDGGVVVNVSDGVEPYTYSIDGTTFQESNIFGNLLFGDYIMTVKDNIDSTKTLNFNIGGPDYTPMTIIIDITDITIFGESTGKITVNVTGGSGSYEYKLNTGEYPNTEGEYTTNNVFENLTYLFHSISVKDGIDTVYKDHIFIDQPYELIIHTVVSNSIGEITISNVNGGYGSYEYSIKNVRNFQSSNTFTGLESNIPYTTFIVKDEYGAIDTLILENEIIFHDLQIGDEYLGGIVFELTGEYPNQTGKVVANIAIGGSWIRSVVIDHVSNYNILTSWRLPYLSELQYIIPKVKDGTLPLSQIRDYPHGYWINTDVQCEWSSNGGLYSVFSSTWEDVRCELNLLYRRGLPVSEF